jgi:hypothetical protein
MWRSVAPSLARRFTVICANLRGYGNSGCPASSPDHAPYAKRAMANDMVSVMGKLGFPRCSVAGHDRGGRVAYRLAACTSIASKSSNHAIDVSRLCWSPSSLIRLHRSIHSKRAGHRRGCRGDLPLLQQLQCRDSGFVQSGFYEVALTTRAPGPFSHATSQNPQASQISCKMTQGGERRVVCH